jgi:drug/metabolite transporter (DMT)-like permease
MLRRLRLLLIGRAPRVTVSSTRARDLVALMLAAACWGLGTVISKSALEDLSPIVLLAVQLTASVVVLATVMRVRGLSLRSDAPPLLGRLGVLNPGVAYALSLVGLMTISASVSVLLWALEPIVILLLAAIFLRERITPTLVMASAAAIAGVALVVYEPATGAAQAIGVGLTLAGVVCCAVYTVVTRRFIPDASETSQVVLTQQAYGLGAALVTLVVVIISGADPLPSSLSPIGLVSAITSGVLYFAGAYWLYLGALRRVTASAAAATFYLIPIVGVTAAALLLGERLAPIQWVGAAVVLLSVIAILARAPSGAAPIAVSEHDRERDIATSEVPVSAP